MNKTAILLLGTAFTLLLSSCGLSEARREAKEKKEKYTPAFEQAVKDAYGEDVRLKSVKCGVNAYTNDVFSTSFSSGGLTGKIKLGGNTYNVSYNTLSHELRDDVHSQAIADSVTAALPFDSTQYIMTSCPVKMLTPDTDSLDRLIGSGEGCRFNVDIITTEDMSAYTETDFLQIPEIKKIAEADGCDLFIDVACLEKNSRSDAKALMFDMSQGGVYFESGDRPWKSVQSGNKDVFELYGIRNVLHIDFAKGQNIVLTE